MLIDKMLADGTYRVIERNAIDKVLHEQDFSNSNRADPNTAAKIGQSSAWTPSSPATSRNSDATIRTRTTVGRWWAPGRMAHWRRRQARSKGRGGDHRPHGGRNHAAKYSRQ